MTVTGAQAWATVNGPLTSGMVGIPVTIKYDEAWEGLIKNFLCRCSPWEGDSSETRTILNVGDTAVVAPEVMQAGQYLHLGVEGFREYGELVMPTTWARCENMICYGADSGEDPSADPTLPIWNQLQAQIEQINRDGITQERMEEIREYAEAATLAATNAARSEQKAAASASVSTSNVNAAESFAIQAQTSEQNAKVSASSAANLANGALQAQRAAEEAAQRAETEADSIQHQDYTALSNKPSINGVVLEGDKTAEDLGIGQPSDEQVGAAVGDWLEAHPEATTVVADRSITAAKTTFIETVVQNLIDISQMVKGGIAEDTGEIGTTAGYSTDYIPVEPGKTYRCNVGFGTGGNWASYYYDADKKTVSIIEGNPFTVPEGAAYVRLSWYFNDDPATKKYALFEGTNLWPFTQGTQRYELDGMLTTAVERVVDRYAAVKAVPKNLYRQVGYGNVNGATGVIECVDSGLLRVSDYIELTPDVWYITNCLSSLGFTACYDADKEYVAAFADATELIAVDAYFAFRVTDPNVRYIVNGCEKAISKPISEPFFCRGSAVPETFDGYDVAVPQADIIPALQNLLGITGNELAGLTWAVLGDSITAAPGLERNYHGIVAEKLGLTAIGYGYNGSWVSYTDDNPEGNEMCTRYDTMTDDADIITCMGGANDWTHDAPLGELGDTEKTTFYGALDILCRGLHTKYPGKRIGFMLPINQHNDEEHSKPYREAIFAVCGKYSIPVLDLYHESGISTATEELKAMYTYDGAHPNELGHEVLARKVEAFLKSL